MRKGFESGQVHEAPQPKPCCGSCCPGCPRFSCLCCLYYLICCPCKCAELCAARSSAKASDSKYDIAARTVKALEDVLFSESHM